MAINKNFVIKNGVEVNTSLIVGDATLNMVGVGTTIPGYTLHVGGSRGGIGATDLTVTGITTVGTSGSTSAALSVVGVSTFQGDIILLGSAGVSTISFDASLDKLNFTDNARATFGTGDDLQIYHEGTYSYISNQNGELRIDAKDGERGIVVVSDSNVELYYDNTKTFNTTPQGINVVGVTTSNRLNISGVSTFTSIGSNLIPDGDGSRNIGAAGSEWQDLFIDGTAKIDALEADTAKIGDLTDNRVVIAGASGELEDDSNFTFDGAKLNVGTAATIAVNGNAAFAGIVTVGGDLKVTGDLEITEDLVLDTNLNILGIASIRNLDGSGAGIGSLSVSGVSTFSGLVNVDAGIAANTAIIEDLTNNRVVIAGTSGELEDDANLTFDGSKLNVGSGVATVFVTTGNVAFAGIATVGGALLVGAGVTVGGDILPDSDGSRDLGSSTKEFQDLFIDGTANIDSLAADTAAIGDLTDNRVVIAGSGGELEDDANFTFDGAMLKVGTAATIAVNGNAAFAGIVTVGGNLNVIGDIVYDEITGRNLNITGISTQAGQVNFGTSGVGATIFANGNITISGFGTVANRLNVGSSTLNNRALNAINVSTTVGAVSANNHNASGILFQGYNASVDASNASFVVKSNGSTGIATATPRANLDVDGDARFSGSVVVKDGGNAGAGVTIFDNGNIVASGIVTASSFVGPFSGSTGSFTGDVDIADKIVHTGDTNTAIRFPAADTFSVETAGSERLRIDSAGKILAGHTADISGGGLQVSGSANAGNAGFHRFDANDSGPFIQLLKSRNATVGSNTVVQSGDELGTLNFQGADGTDFHSAARIVSKVDGTPGDNDMPGRLEFHTTSDDSGSPLERLRITSGGIVRAYDNVKFTAGAGDDLQIYHDATDSIIDNNTGDLKISTTGSGDDILIESADDIFLNPQGGENGVNIIGDGAVELYHNNSKRFETTADGADFSGTASVKIPVGTTAQRNGSPVNGDIRYNTDLNSYEGYGNGAWGGLGGGTEIDVSVSSTSATNLTTFAHASYRSASFRVQITQGTSYQVGKYLLIHDGTTVTVVEESAIATGSMLGDITSVINGSNVEIKVTMYSASSATITTIIDKITV